MIAFDGSGRWRRLVNVNRLTCAIIASGIVHGIFLLCVMFLLKEPAARHVAISKAPLLTLVSPPVLPVPPVQATARRPASSQTVSPPVEHEPLVEETGTGETVEEVPAPSADAPAVNTVPVKALGPARSSGPALPVRINGAAELDNTDFSPIVNIKPLYPIIAIRANIEGHVDVDLLVDERGRVETFSIIGVKGHPSFGNETARVIPKWRFPPPRIKGQKVRVKYVYRVNFTLD
jgi:TonB family protein